MLAVHLENKRVSIKQIPRPRAPRGYALIRLLCGGICSTDLELQRGYHGFSGIPGHEFVGEVVEADRRGLVGRRVVGEINLGCGACDWCRRSLGRHCPARKVLGIVKHPGAFREFLTLPERNLHVLPNSISTEEGVFVEPLAAACEILDQVDIPCSSQIAVLGDGKLGLLIAQFLQAYGYRVHQFGHHQEKLRIAASAGVATELVREHLPRAEYEWVVEATGSPKGLTAAVGMTRPRGTVILKSTMHGLVGVDSSPVIVNEIILVGSRCGRFEPAIELLKLGAIHVARMISERIPLDRAPSAFRQAARAGALKVLLA
jgi:alcohol dehydrogenase